MQHRAPRATRLDLIETPAGGPVRISGAYPPPLTPTSSTPVLSDDQGLGSYPRVTRYDRSRHRVGRSQAGRAWTGVSAVLAAAGVAAVVLMPQDQPPPVRIDVPIAAAVAPVATPAADPAGSSAVPAPVLQLAESDPVRVQIPALRVTSRIMDLGLQRDGSMEVPPGAYPVGWYDRSPTPGEVGPAVLAGHVDWGGRPGAFYGLRELLPGDQVIVDRADGSVATFTIDRVEEHEKDDFPTEEVYGDINHAGLRLITCGGAFDKGSGDYEDNIIVFASLTAVG